MKPTPPTQVSFSQAEYDKKKKRTQREIFLEKIEQVALWARLLEATVRPQPQHTSSNGVEQTPTQGVSGRSISVMG